MKYRFGVIFNFERLLKMNDPTGVFNEVDQEKLLIEIVKFLTDDVINNTEAYERVNEIDFLMSMLYGKGIIDAYVFHEEDSYAKIFGVLFGICESVADVFTDTGFYRFKRESDEHQPKVFRMSRGNYAVAVRLDMDK